MAGNKKIFYGVILAALMLAFVLNRTPSPSKAVRSSGLSRAPVSHSTAPSADIDIPAPPSAPPAAQEEPAPPVVSKDFLRWFATEAQNIEARDVDTLATEAELKARVRRFRKNEISYLVSRMSSSLAPASERILASYLVGLAATTSSEALVDIASQGIENPGPHPAHSIEEAKSARERAFKIMAVDAIYNSEAPVSQKIDKLNAIVNHTPDATVKQYAADKADDLDKISQ
jgi:hypothetical protein